MAEAALDLSTKASGSFCLTSLAAVHWRLPSLFTSPLWVRPGLPASAAAPPTRHAGGNSRPRASSFWAFDGDHGCDTVTVHVRACARVCTCVCTRVHVHVCGQEPDMTHSYTFTMGILPVGNRAVPEVSGPCPLFAPPSSGLAVGVFNARDHGGVSSSDCITEHRPLLGPVG